MRFLFFLLLISRAALADKYYVEEASGTGIGPDESIAVMQFVRSGVTQNGETLVSVKDQADYVLRPKVMKLGRAYLMSLEKRRGDDVVFSSQMKAKEIEELDEVAARLTRAVMAGVQAKHDARVDDVTQDEETRGTRRKPARKGYYLAFGPGWLSKLNNPGLGFYLAGAYAWDVNRAIIKIRGDLTVKGGAIFTDFGFGSAIFLSDRDFAPFVGVDLGFGVVRVDTGTIFNNDTSAGFVVGPVAGVHLLRTSSIQVEIAARLAVMLKAGTFGSPTAFTARLGLYF